MTDPIDPQAAAPDFAGWIAAARARYADVTHNVAADATILSTNDLATVLSATCDARIAVALEEWLENGALEEGLEEGVTVKRVAMHARAEAETWQQKADRLLANAADSGQFGSMFYGEAVAMAYAWNRFSRDLGI